MDKVNHGGWTPGPWGICDGPVGYGHRIYSEAMPEELAVVCDVTLGRDVSLLATAPELYEALEDLVRNNAPEHVEAAKAVLAKARGAQ